MQTLKPALIDALKARGVELAVPLSDYDWATLTSDLSFIFTRNLKKNYVNFNGFIAPDYKSQMRLWNVSEVISKNRDIGLMKSDAIFCIGDFLIESSYIFMNSETNILNFDNDKDQYFVGIESFVGELVAGNFDFL